MSGLRDEGSIAVSPVEDGVVVVEVRLMPRDDAGQPLGPDLLHEYAEQVMDLLSGGGVDVSVASDGLTGEIEVAFVAPQLE